MNKITLIILTIVAFSCTRNKKIIDEKLVGQWTDTNTRYEFKDDFTYNAKYLRVGVLFDSATGSDLVFNDSVYGEYFVESKRNNLTFNLKGYRDKAGNLTDTSLNSSTWNYYIENDTILHFESNTSIGTMKRVQ